MSANALNKQSKTGERYDLQAHLVALAAQYPGYTGTQLSWLAAGGEVDAQGFCVPAAAFRQSLAFFNAKRRVSEIARDPDAADGRRPNAKLQYGKARLNPYDFGGNGVYPLGWGVNGVPVKQLATTNPAEVRSTPPRSSTGMPAELQAMVDGF